MGEIGSGRKRNLTDPSFFAPSLPYSIPTTTSNASSAHQIANSTPPPFLFLAIEFRTLSLHPLFNTAGEGMALGGKGEEGLMARSWVPSPPPLHSGLRYGSFSNVSEKVRAPSFLTQDLRRLYNIYMCESSSCRNSISFLIFGRDARRRSLCASFVIPFCYNRRGF